MTAVSGAGRHRRTLTMDEIEISEVDHIQPLVAMNWSIANSATDLATMRRRRAMVQIRAAIDRI
jgi:hypothetical protein